MTATGRPEALAAPSAKKPAQRSSMCETHSIRGSRTSESTSGAEREPGRRARVAHAAAREFVAERAQEQVGVGGSHDLAVAPTLVLLHGFTHTGRSWDGVVAALGERYRPIAPDIRGHGSAASTPPVTLDAVIADLDRLDRRALHARRATRWGAGSRFTMRSRDRTKSSASS